VSKRQSPIRCDPCSGIIASTLLTLPPASVANNDHNPDRVKPRDIFDLAVGTDNLFRTETVRKVALRFTLSNVTNKVGSTTSSRPSAERTSSRRARARYL
jgi:hypothetical protein